MSGWKGVLDAARGGAVSGGAAALGVVLVRDVAAMVRQGARKRDMLCVGVTRAGAGAAIGVAGALAASATGAGLTLVAGRGLLALAAPVLAGTAVAAALEAPIERVVGRVVDGAAAYLRRQGDGRVVRVTEYD